MTSITAAVLNPFVVGGGHQPLDLEVLQLAPPKATELLVRIDAAGLCHSDLSVMNGSRPRPLPMALGHEATGMVEGIGSAISDVSLGDRVVMTFVPACGRCERCLGGRPALCEGAAASNMSGELASGGIRLTRGDETIRHHLGVSAFATYAVVDRGSIVVVPASTPAPIAALFGCAVLTGAGAVLNTAVVRPGESVVVIGLGGIGLSALMAAHAAGAHPVIAIDPVPQKRALALEVGASVAADLDEGASIVRAHAPRGVDVVIEAAGRPSATELGFDYAGRGGRIVTVGLPDPADHIRIPAARLVGEGKSVTGSYLGDSVPKRDIPRLLALWDAGRFPIDRLLTATRPLSEINEGFDDLASGHSVRTVVIPGG